MSLARVSVIAQAKRFPPWSSESRIRPSREPVFEPPPRERPRPRLVSLIPPSEAELERKHRAQRVAHLRRAAFAAGVAGAAAMSVLMALGVWLQWSPFSTEMLLGGVLRRRPDSFTFAIGWIWHLINGGVFGMVYGALFRQFGSGTGGVPLGLLFGVFHWLVASLAVNALLAVNPWTSDGEFQRMAIFGGMTVWGALLLHLVFGAIVGGFYRRASRIASPTR